MYRERLLQLLSQHYEGIDLDIDRLPRREIAFGRYGRSGLDDRHNGYATKAELHEHLSENKDIVSIFSSVAYYLDPHEPMNTKKDIQSWDLIFDLDSRPLEDESKIAFISRMANTTKQLIDEHLVGEFGFDVEDMEIDWSGNKGFHVTLSDERYQNYSLESRKRLLKHINMVGVIDRGLYNTDNATVNPVCGGWKKRYHKVIEDTVALSFDQNALIEYGYPKVTAKKISDLLEDDGCYQSLEAGRLKVLMDKDPKILTAVKRLCKKKHKHLIDALDVPVSTKRYGIFRVPNSIHEKSGLPCVRLQYTDLENPQRIIETMWEALGTDLVEIHLEHPVTIEYDKEYELEPGIQTVPRFIAIPALIKLTSSIGR